MPTHSVKVQSGANGWQGEGAYSCVVVGNSSHRFIIDSNAWGEEAERLAMKEELEAKLAKSKAEFEKFKADLMRDEKFSELSLLLQ